AHRLLPPAWRDEWAWVLHSCPRAGMSNRLRGARAAAERPAAVASERSVLDPDLRVDFVHVLLHAFRRGVVGGHVGPAHLGPRVLADLLVLVAGGAAD